HLPQLPYDLLRRNRPFRRVSWSGQVSSCRRCPPPGGTSTRWSRPKVSSFSFDPALLVGYSRRICSSNSALAFKSNESHTFGLRPNQRGRTSGVDQIKPPNLVKSDTRNN